MPKLIGSNVAISIEDICWRVKEIKVSKRHRQISRDRTVLLALLL